MPSGHSGACARPMPRNSHATQRAGDALAKIGEAKHLSAGLAEHVTALALYRQTRCEAGIASQLRFLGDIALAVDGDSRSAMAAYHVAGAVSRRATDWKLAADVHLRIGDVCVAWGNREGAKERYTRASAIYKRGNDARGSKLCADKIEELA